MAEAVVYNFTDLKARALDSVTDTVYLGADITIESGGISLTKNKPYLVIDGRYPKDGGDIHTITDYNNLVQTDAIRVAATAGAFELTLKNCAVVGRNFFGVISAVLSGQNTGVVLSLENVDYSGPQAIYNCNGETRIKDCSFRIGKYNGTTAETNETFETNSLVFSGRVDIYHDGTPNSCIWLTSASPRFTLSQGANVTVTTTGRELLYNDGGAADIILGKNSSLVMNTNWGFFYSSGMSASSFKIEEGAQLIVDQRAARSGVATIRCSGNFKAEAGSRIIIIRSFTATEPLLQLSGAATATFNNPKSVVLYNCGGRVIDWISGTGTLDVTAGQINYWTQAAALPDAGGFDDVPLYRWQKADNTDAWINATLDGSSTTHVATNIIQGTDAEVIPDTTTFSVSGARVLSFGSLSLSVDKITEFAQTLSGATDPYANVRTVVGGATTETQANSEGAFNALLIHPMAKSESVTVLANIDFKTVSAEAQADGELSFLFVPPRLPFTNRALPVRSEISGRAGLDWSITVRDSRLGGGEWYLFAQASSPLSSDTAQLEDALIFKSGEEISALSPTPVKIFTGQGNTGEYTDTVISWRQIEGLLLRLATDEAYRAGRYTTDITFILSDEEL